MYKQTDITSYFGNAKMKRYDKRKYSKPMYVSNVVVEISDDSDFETLDTVCSKKTRKKLKLPYPISDEDEMDENAINRVKNVKSMVKQAKKKKSSTNDVILPRATSTPLKSKVDKQNGQTPHIVSTNVSTFSADTIPNQSESFDFGHCEILDVEISPSNKNEEGSSKHMISMMQVNRPKKSSYNQICIPATSSPSKTNEQNENEKDITLQNGSNNTSTSSSDTIILNKDGISYHGDQTTSRNQDDSVKAQNLISDEKQKKESVIYIPQNNNATHQPQTNENYNKYISLESNASVSSDSETQPGNSSKLINLTPSKSNCSKFAATTPSRGKASSKQIVSSTSPSSTIYKNNFGSPNKTSTKLNQVIQKTIAAEPSASTSHSKNMLQLKTEEEDEKLNLKHLDCMKELFEDCLEDDKERLLLLASDKEIIKKFLEMDVHCQYLLVKLFLYIPKWYNINKFCTKIKLDQKISASKVNKMYYYLKEHKFVDTDIRCLGIDVLLDMLLVGDLRRICAKFKLGSRNNKKDLIGILKKNCRTQSTLSSTKSTEDLLKDAIIDKLGNCMKLKEDIKKSFYKAYLLQTFTNSLYLDPYKYLNDMNYLNITYPDYTIEGYSPFSCIEQFASFYEAVMLKKDYFDASDKKKVFVMKDLCDTAFDRLRNITKEGKYSRCMSVYLQRFSAEYQYISLLRTGAKKLITYNETVKTWLQFLIENYQSHYALGFWYKQLAHILVKYEKDYESAANIVIQALELNKSQNIFNLVELYNLNILAERIKKSKSYKVSSLFCDKLENLSELLIRYDNFPKKTIAGQTNRNETYGRRTYSFLDDNGEENYGNVEMIVLKYYEKTENYEGIHCEGRLIANIFTLLFWDIIYYYYVPNTFISKFQLAPLDMYTDFFYKNRKSEIDERLQDIAQNWTSEKIENFLKENWDYHSHKETITNFKTVSASFQEFLRMFKCIDRKLLSQIFKRLVSNFKIFQSGLPDLFLWNSDSSKCKFVEVKGEGDKLSHKQILWIQYLMDIGADVEVCHVSGVGSRKIKNEDDN